MTSSVAAARVLLFVPANRAERFDKACASGADAVILDLEDAVGAEQKPKARADVREFLERGRAGGPAVGLRINHPGLPDGIRDLAMLCDMPRWPAFLVLPKVESATEPELIDSLARQSGQATELVCTIESARGLARAPEISAAVGSVKALALGGFDFAADIGAKVGWEPLYFARAALVQAAASARVGVIDTPWGDIADLAGLRDECARLRGMGFTGRLAIHPSHVEPIREAFAPSAAEIDEAREIVGLAASHAGDAVKWRGRMIDEALLRSARRILATALLPTG